MSSHEPEKKAFWAKAWHVLYNFRYFLFCGCCKAVKAFFWRRRGERRSRNKWAVCIYLAFSPQFQFMEEQRKTCPDLWAAASPANLSLWPFPHFSRQDQECCCFPGGSTNKAGLKQHFIFAKEHSLDSGAPQHWFPPAPSHRNECHPFPHPFGPITISLLTLGHSNPRISSKVPALRDLLEITKLQENTERAAQRRGQTAGISQDQDFKGKSQERWRGDWGVQCSEEWSTREKDPCIREITLLLERRSLEKEWRT